MSDNDDLLGDDLGDQSLADYNLGNEEEEQLLADDYEGDGSQNVPPSAGPYYEENTSVSEPDFSRNIEFSTPQEQYRSLDAESVVPNITVEVPNVPTPSILPEHRSFAPYDPTFDREQAVPPAIPAQPVELPQTVPSEANVTNGDARERFNTERPVGAQRMPQVRDIPDSLDKVLVPRGRGGRVWRASHYSRHRVYRRADHAQTPYSQNPQFPTPQTRPKLPQHIPNQRPNVPQLEPRPESPQLRPPSPQIRPELQVRPDLPEMRPDLPHLAPDLPHDRPDMPPMRPDMPPMRPDMPPMRPDMPPMRPDMPQMRPDMPQMRPEMPPMRPNMPHMRPEMRPMRPDMHQIRHEVPQMRPNMPPEMRHFRPDMQMRPEMHMRPDFRPNMPPRMQHQQMGPDMNMPHDMPMQGPFRPQMEHFPQFNQRFPPNFNQNRPPMFQGGPYPRGPFRPFGPRDGPNMPRMGHMGPMRPGGPVEPEVRMLPVLPPNLPPGKKVLINPHFKGNFQPPAEVQIPIMCGTAITYTPTRIQGSPPRSPPLAPKDIDEAAERFIAEQRSALARAANRKIPRRSPQRYIENTTIEIENDLARGPPADVEDELSRKQRQFIEANRAGLRRRMRSPTPPRRSLSPRRSRSISPRRARSPPRNDEESEYRRRVREQETLRERVLRAKEQRRRKNAVALQKQIDDRERERKERETKQGIVKEKEQDKILEPQPPEKDNKPEQIKSPIRERSPIKEETKPAPEKEKIEETKVERENLTPPREHLKLEQSPERNLTPPLPPKVVKEDFKLDSDDDLDLILDDIDDILSDEDDSGRFKEKPKKVEPPKPKQVDLRNRLPPKQTEKQPKQRIVFNDNEDKNKEKTPPPPTKKNVVTSSTKIESSENSAKKISSKAKMDAENATTRMRQRIIFDKKSKQEREATPPTLDEKATPFSRRVVLQRKITQTIQKTDKEKSVFSRIEIKNDPSKPNPGIFSRAVRTAIGTEPKRIIVKNTEEPEVRYESDSDSENETQEELNTSAIVDNLPYGMTDTRLKTLAGADAQNIMLDKEARSAKITFKTTSAAASFKKKFNNKMVSASRLTVVLK